MQKRNYKKIVVAVDSFKGSASSFDICQTIANSCHEILPDCEVIEIPIADGGEGTLDSLIQAHHNFSTINILTTDPLRRPIHTHYIIDSSNTAYIELATASGLTLLNEAERNPLFTTTEGVGSMIYDALHRGCANIVLGIGGSATNDAGIGILSALGFKFLDNSDTELYPCGANLEKIHSITAPDSEILTHLKNFTILADVTNPFCGPNGAAYIFAPQKGASSEMCRSLDRGMAHFATIAQQFTGINLNQIRGGGAAGGVGASMVAFLNAQIKSGIDFILDNAGFDSAISDADLVITGEGKLDNQSKQGKAVSGIINRCTANGTRVIAIAGCIEEGLQLDNLHAAYCINPPGLPLHEAMKYDVTLNNIRATIHAILSNQLVITPK